MSSDLTIRRIIVVVVSLITGLVATLITFALIGTDFAEFGMESIIVVVTIAIAAMIWLDHFLNTKILPD